MKWNININQKAVIDMGVDIDIIDAAIIDQCMSFSHSKDCGRMFLDGETFYWLGYENIAEQLPLLKLKKDSVYRRLKKMADLGLLIPHPNNQAIGKPFYAFTEKCVKCTYGYKSEGTDQNPKGYGSKSELGTDENPDNNNIRDNNIKKIKEQASPPCTLDVQGGIETPPASAYPGEVKKASGADSKEAEIQHKADSIIEYLNVKAKKKRPYSATSDSVRKHLIPRLKLFPNVEDYKAIIDLKVEEWLGKTDKKGKPLSIYLRPETLFSAAHFDTYLSEAIEVSSFQQSKPAVHVNKRTDFRH
jgi:uncharacterized phage protein (TIGR02220 family)